MYIKRLKDMPASSHIVNSTLKKTDQLQFASHTQFNSCLEFVTFLKWAPMIYTNALSATYIETSLRHL